MSTGSELEGTTLAFLDEITQQGNTANARQQRVLGVASQRMLAELREIYAKFENKGTGTYQAQQLYARLRNTKDLLPPKEAKALTDAFKGDLAKAYDKGSKTAKEMAEILKATSDTLKKTAKPNLPAIDAAGKRLQDFWAKENTAFRDRVTALTQTALAQGMGYRKLALQVRELLVLERDSGRESARSARLRERMGIAGRAELIARTELQTAAIQGKIASFREMGYQWARWSATAERSCPFCISRDGLLYTLDDVEGAIPAHPRCRCSLIPADPPPEFDKRRFEDKGIDAAESLDDAFWARARAEKIRTFQAKNPTIDDAAIRRYVRTPTNSQAYLKPGTPAPAPQWAPSGQLIPNLERSVLNAQRAAERAKQQDAAKDDQKRLEKEAKEAEAKAKAEAEKKAEAERKAADAKRRKEKEEQDAKDRELDRLRKELDNSQFQFVNQNRPEGNKPITREMWDSLSPKMKERLVGQSKGIQDKRAKEADKKLAEKKEIDAQYEVVSKAFGTVKKIDRDKFGSLSAADRKRLYDAAVGQLVKDAENKGKAKAEKTSKAKTDKDTPVKAETSDAKLKRLVKDLGENLTASGLTAAELARALQRAKKYVIFDKQSEFAAAHQAMQDITQDVMQRIKTEQAEKARKVPKKSDTFKGDDHFVSQKLSKLTGKDLDKLFELMEAEGGLIAKNADKLKRFINHHEIALYFSNAALAPKGWSSKAEAKLKDSWEEVRNSDAWQRSVKRSQGIHGTKNVLGNAPEAELAAKWNASYVDDATKGDWFTAKNYNANKSSGGYTKVGTSFVTIKDARTSKPPTQLDIDVLKKSYANALESAASNGGRNNKQLTAEDAYREIYKTKKDWSGSWINTLIHELGHQVHFKGGQTNMSGQVADHYNNKVADNVRDGAIFPSKYAGVNNFEQFAENFTTYMLAPDTLKRLSPKTYEWIDNHMLNALNWKYD